MASRPRPKIVVLKGGAGEYPYDWSMFDTPAQKQPINEKPVVFPLRGPHYKQRLKESGQRWWWVWLIVALLLLMLLTLPPAFFIAYPKVAQTDMDSADLKINSMRVTNAQPDSFTLELDSTITTTVSQHPTLDAFNASMYLEGQADKKPFLIVEFPATKTAAVTNVSIAQTVYVTEKTRAALTRYNEVVMMSETYKVTTEGTTTLHLPGFPATQISGFNAFPDLYTNNPLISAKPDANGDNFWADVHLKNPSVMTLDLGTATFQTYFNGKNLGTSYLDSFVLRPGNNTLRLRSAVDQTPIMSAITKPGYCETGEIPIKLIGQYVLDENGNQLDYFEGALKMMPFEQNITVATAIENLTGSRPTCAS